MEKKFYLTKKGLERTKREYRDLKKIRLAKTKGESPPVLHSGDLNPEYISFKEDLDFLESRIAELEYILKNTELIKPPPRNKRNIVNLGATVVLEDKEGDINKFVLVGTLEANPSQKKISSHSPIGKSLLGHKKGEEIIITSPVRTTYKIKDIKYGSA